MNISKSEFEEEINSLLNAARSASGRETARKYLVVAVNKVNAYDNIPSYLIREYMKKIEDVMDELDL